MEICGGDGLVGPKKRGNRITKWRDATVPFTLLNTRKPCGLGPSLNISAHIRLSIALSGSTMAFGFPPFPPPLSLSLLTLTHPPVFVRGQQV